MTKKDNWTQILRPRSERSNQHDIELDESLCRNNSQLCGLTTQS